MKLEKLYKLAAQAKRKRAKSDAYLAAAFVLMSEALYKALVSEEEAISMSEAKQTVETLAKLLELLDALSVSESEKSEASQFFRELIEKLSSSES